MPARIIANIYRRVQVSHAESLLLQAILKHTDTYGRNGQVAHAVLEAQTGYSRSHIYVLIRKLEDRHLLRVERRRIGAYRNDINIYTVLRPWVQEIDLFERPEPTRQRRKALRSMPYEAYIKTPEWRMRRKIHLRLARYRCQACNSKVLLQVHHRTYQRLGIEEDFDLLALCADCHALFHRESGLTIEQER